MKYSEMRDKIKPGHLLAFSHPVSMFNSIYDFKIGCVRMFGKTEYCHVGIAWPMSGRVFCLEAVMPQVRIFPLSKLGDFYWVPLEIDWTKDTEEFALSVVGEYYSQWEAIKAYFNVKRDDEKYWYCDAYCREVYKKAGLQLAGDLMPTGLVHEVQKRGSPVYLIEN